MFHTLTMAPIDRGLRRYRSGTVASSVGGFPSWLSPDVLLAVIMTPIEMVAVTPARVAPTVAVVVIGGLVKRETEPHRRSGRRGWHSLRCPCQHRTAPLEQETERVLPMAAPGVAPAKIRTPAAGINAVAITKAAPAYLGCLFQSGSPVGRSLCEHKGQQERKSYAPIPPCNSL